MSTSDVNEKDLSATSFDSSLISSTTQSTSSKRFHRHSRKHDGFTVHQWAFSCFICICIGMGISYLRAPSWLESDFEEKYQQGYEEGSQYGYDDGYSDGYDKGLSDGYDNGYFDGTNKFSEKSYDDGYDEGYGRGYEVGHESGYDAGYTAACESNYASAYMYTSPDIPSGTS